MDCTMRVTSCPYCRGGTGLIRVDAWPLLRADREERGGSSEPIPIDSLPGQQVVLFGSGWHRRPPCDHLVHLTIELTAWGRTTAYSYRHPELAQHDPDQLVLAYLRDAFAGDVECDLDEDVWYYLREIDITSHIRDFGDNIEDEAEIHLRAWVVFAQDAEMFAAEVQAAARSCEAETSAAN